jgi:hypothetical protein
MVGPLLPMVSLMAVVIMFVQQRLAHMLALLSPLHTGCHQLPQLSWCNYQRMAGGSGVINYYLALVVEQEKVDVGHRIRDLEVLPTGVAVATTDSGQLLLISLAS